MRVWAENDVYGPGHGSFTGQANKLDPGATISGDGNVPGEPRGAQHSNFVLNELTKQSSLIEDQAFLSTLTLCFKESATSNTSDGVAALFRDEDFILFVNGNNFRVQGNVPHIGPLTGSQTASLPIAAVNPSSGSILFPTAAVGNGAEFRATFDPGSYTAITTNVAGSLGSLDEVDYDEDNAEWLAWGNNSNGMGRSTLDPPTTWTVHSINGAGGTVTTGVHEPGGRTFAVKSGNTTADFRRTTTTTDNTTWEDCPSAPDLTTQNITGNLAAVAGCVAYCCKLGSDMVVFVSNDGGDSWYTSLTVVLPGVAASFCFADRYSGAIYAIADSGGKSFCYMTRDLGQTWLGPAIGAGALAFGAAGGYLWYKENEAFYRSAFRLPPA